MVRLPFLSQEEVADISVLDPVAAHIELIEGNNVLRKVIADSHASMESATRTYECTVMIKHKIQQTISDKI